MNTYIYIHINAYSPTLVYFVVKTIGDNDLLCGVSVSFINSLNPIVVRPEKLERFWHL